MIRTQLLDYIGQSPAGSSIKASVYHFWDTEVAQALADARTRGVDVQLMLDESSVSDNPDNGTYGILTAALGTDTAQNSFVGLCPVNKSCLGDPSLGASINHNKFWLFSSSRASRWPRSWSRSRRPAAPSTSSTPRPTAAWETLHDS
ncbi:phospholipase D-like domain-containing protein [Streptomyces sp. NPDC050619]|uniref:phospholipase D-like domain-containing protein n=1 Tax=Streptomyces sp. NPDC050619 TaxID=3157214 RepID=UPI00342F1D0B